MVSLRRSNIASILDILNPYPGTWGGGVNAPSPLRLCIAKIIRIRDRPLHAKTTDIRY